MRGVLFPCDQIEQSPCMPNSLCYGRSCNRCSIFSAKRNPFNVPWWALFWFLCEAEAIPFPKWNPAYEPNPECDFCDDWYNCPDCPARLDAEAEDREERFAEEEDYVP